MLLGLDGNGLSTFCADVGQWQETVAAASSAPSRRQSTRAASRPKRRSGLTYLEKKEYQGMEEAISEAEARLTAARVHLEDPDVASDAERAHRAYLAVQQAQATIDALYERWAHLEEKLEGT